MVSGIKRSESLLQPDLFRYHNHFEFLGLLGRTHLSEVRRAGACGVLCRCLLQRCI